MKNPLVIVLALIAVIPAASQKISRTFNPILKETPQPLFIVEHRDGSYLLFGRINYYGNSPSGALMKIDGTGARVGDFPTVTADKQIHDVFILPSGKILIHGEFSYINGVRTGRIAMLHQDGSLDRSFDVSPSLKITGFTVQSTGKLVVIVDGLLSRLNADGSPDPTFFTDISLNYVRRAVTTEEDKIYLVRSSQINRLNPDGTLDDTFLFPAEPYTNIEHLVTQPDGKFVISITRTIASPPYTQTHTVQRHNQDGSVDNSFTAPIAESPITDIVIRQTGKIAITGLMNSLDGQNGNAFELHADGSFNKVLLVTDYNGVDNLSEDSNGNIFITGGFKRVNSSVEAPFIAKLRQDYTVDEAFALPVFRTTGTNTYLPVAIQKDGRLLVGGSFFFSGAGEDTGKLVRLLPDGSLDTSFNPEIIGDVGNVTNPSVNTIAVQDDDKIIVGGSNLFRTLSTNVNRLLPDGKIDDSFAVGTGFTRSNGWVGSVFSIRVRDSKIYVSGYFDRYNGKPCQSFAILDMNGTKIGPQVDVLPQDSYFQDMEIQSDGKIILMGSFTLTPGDTRSFIRLNPDGSLDDTFGLKVLAGNPFEFDIDRDDNIWVVGNNLDLVSNQILMRFNRDGVIDNTLDLGSGFTASGGYTLGYFVEVLNNNSVAVGGMFSGYREVSSPGLLIMNGQGSVVSMANEFDSTSYAVVGVFDENILFTAGHFMKDKGLSVTSGAKVLFPIQNTGVNLRADAASESSINVSWQGAFNGAEQIIVERSAEDASAYEIVATLPANAEGYIADELSEVSAYHFRITASNEFYTTDSFEAVDTTWIAPQILLPPTEVTSESFVANWEYLPGTDSCMLQVSGDNFVTFLAGYENMILQSGSRLVEGLEPGTVYQYRVRRFKNNKTSAFSEAEVANIISASQEHLLNVRAFPNPVRDHLMVNLPANPGVTSVTVHSICGEQLFMIDLVDKTEIEVDTRLLTPGLYVLTVSSGRRTQRIRFVRSQ